MLVVRRVHLVSDELRADHLLRERLLEELADLAAGALRVADEVLVAHLEVPRRADLRPRPAGGTDRVDPRGEAGPRLVGVPLLALE